MDLGRLNRVELLLPGEDVAAAARAFNDVLGGHLAPPMSVAGQGVCSTVDYALKLEVFGPEPDSPRRTMLDAKRPRGAVGPIVFEVDDYDAARAEVLAKGHAIAYEYGAPGVRQLHLDPTRLFGFGITFTERRSHGIGTPSAVVDDFEKLELLVGQDEIDAAVVCFNDLLGAHFRPPTHLPDQDVLTTTDFDARLELLAPASPNSPVQRSLERKGRGAIGPIVWRVADIDAAKAHVAALGYRVAFEYRADGRHQVHLDPEQLYGYGITFSNGRGSTGAGA